MADSIIEKLALKVVEAVEDVDGTGTYNTKLSDVVRDNRIGHNPRHLLAVIRQDYDDEAGVETANEIIVTIPVVFIVNVYVTPSDNDQTAIDRLLNHVWADVTVAITAGWADKTADTIGGLAYNWTVLTPQAFEASDGSYQGIACRYRALVRVEENDPYTQR